MTVGNKVTAYKYNKNDELLRTDTLNTDTEEDSVVIYKNDKNGNQLATVNRYEIPSDKKDSSYVDIDVTLGDNRLNENVVNHYNALNQLTQTLTKNYKVSFTYDAEGLRTSKTVNGEKTFFVWDGDQLVMELSESGKVQKRYVRGNDLVYADKGTDTEKQYYVTDPHGNVVQLTDESGKVTKIYEYDSFGNEVNPDSKDDNPFRYCGEYYDKETEEIYLRARYYQPEVGRFLTRDTYTGEEDVPESLHLYTYCGNDGVNNVDPGGHKPRTFEKYWKKKHKKIKDGYTNATHVELKKNKVNITTHVKTYGDDEKELPSKKTTYREQIIKGIENKWTGKVKIKGYKVKVKMNVIDGGELGYYRKDQKFNTVNVIDKDGTSATTVGEWKRNESYNVKLYTGFKSGGKRTASDVRNTAAHEFGHVFGVEDAYKYEISDKISPKKDLMRWNAGVTPQMTKYDVIMVLRAFTYNKYQRWSRYDKMVKKKEYE